MLTYFMYLELRRYRFTGWKTRREGEGKRQQERYLMRERLYEREEKTHISHRNEGPLGLQRRDEQDGLQEEEMNRVVSGEPLSAFLMTLAPRFWLQTLRRLLPPRGLSWYRLCCDTWPFLLPSSGEVFQCSV